ncbi:MAG: tRNA (guanosine(37)-N1)-methyltransferase TrmD, partial [Clostridia bacterium]|nr:tRNA (guanosine(37)-N1)-methyltransferase TrmD [Clostridia bacterium]
MKVDILTVMPGMFEGPFAYGVVARARERGLLELRVIDLRDFTDDRHRTTDDYPFGGGPGMVMKPEPIGRAVDRIRAEALGRVRVLLLSPQGRRLEDGLVRELAREPHLALVCGRYEGVDERVRELLVDDEVSIGDYVLSGGELAAMVVVDAVARHLPGALGAPLGAEEESFAGGLLEWPQYTRPRVWRGLSVPEVLLTGDHGRIARWRRRAQLERTLRRRPDLLERAELSEEDRRILAELRERGAPWDGGR